jgi:YegS/Rv2252/BmrU family lipid kinase
MHRNIAYLLNPVSGTNGPQSLQPLIEQQTRARGIAFRFHPTDRYGRYRELEDEIKSGGITDIVVAGGDGTISAVTAALRHTGVRFGIIPRGSGNGLAFAAGIPKDPLKALDIVFTGKARLVDGFMINNRFSCMLSGIGFDASVAHAFAREKKRGLWTYVKVSARNFFRAEPYPFTITTASGTTHTDAYFISLANANQFGNQFTIAPKARLNDGLIDVVVVQKMNKLQLLLAVLHQLRYGDVREDIFRKHGILYFQAEKILIENPSLAPLHIDGDPAETHERFDIQTVREAFLLLQP